MTTKPKPNLDLALEELRRARNIAVLNAPIHETAGDTAQAELCRDVAKQCHYAIMFMQHTILS